MSAKKILVVDDSKTMRQQIEVALSTEGYEIVEAENGLEAIEIINSEEELSLVIADINMPLMTGIEMLERIQDHIQAGLPVILLTTESLFVKRGKALGAKGWIIKPFRTDQLITAVNSLAR